MLPHVIIFHPAVHMEPTTPGALITPVRTPKFTHPFADWDHLWNHMQQQKWFYVVCGYYLKIHVYVFFFILKL